MVSYSNALPFHYRISLDQLQLHLAPPASLFQRLYEFDAALVSTPSLEHYPMWIPYGISSLGAVASVLLYTRSPLHQITTVKITKDSTTSVRLLKILFAFHWNVPVHYTTEDEPPHDALLQIGDRALQNPTLPGYTTYDLSQVWHEWTGLPFVFACFVAQHPGHAVHAKRIIDTLEYNLTHREPIITHVANTLSLSEETIRSYFQRLHYHIGPQEHAAITLFRKLYDVYEQQIL